MYIFSNNRSLNKPQLSDGMLLILKSVGYHLRQKFESG